MARILLIDDDSAWLNLIRRALPEYDVHEAQSFQNALALLDGGVIYDVAIVDLNLLGDRQDNLGGRLLEIMRDNYPTIRRIALTDLPPTAVKAAVFDRYDVDDLLLKQNMNLVVVREVVEVALARTASDIPLHVRATKSEIFSSLRSWKANTLLGLNQRAHTLRNDVLEANRVGKRAEDSARELGALETRKRYVEEESSKLEALVAAISTDQDLVRASREFERLKGNVVSSGKYGLEISGSQGVQIGDQARQHSRFPPDRNLFAEEPPEGIARGGGDPEPRRRFLKGQCPESVPVNKPFSLLASIVLETGPSRVKLDPFDVPPEGRDVLLILHAPGMRLLSEQRQVVHVPAGGDSRPVMFELRAGTPGPKPVSITAWIGGTYLGELLIEITAERDPRSGLHRDVLAEITRDVLAEITTEPTEGAVSLVVRYDPTQNAYRFEFRDEDNPDEVTSNLAYDPAPLVERLIAGLDDLAKGRSGYSANQTWNYLVNEGAGLWSQLVPARLREQFWERQHRIRQLTILCDRDVVPWELLYPMDPGHDDGFLVQQFPVTRAIFRWRAARTLKLQPARFVLPEGSLPEARNEIETMRRLLASSQERSEVISALTSLQDLIANGNFGLLHFACHNTYNPIGGSSIKLGNVQFTPGLMTTAAINKVLVNSGPTIFINACRSAGLAATYNRLDGWANKFLEAGAAAFIGSLWAVTDRGACEFAKEFYSQLESGSTLGEAAMRTRQAVASQSDDPTWLAYAVYGNPRATISY